MAGVTLQWIRDGIRLIEDAAESEAMFGLTRDTGIQEIVTAGLMSVCYQTQDLVEAIAADGAPLQILRVDGGMVRNNYMLQKLADLLKVEVHRSWTIETTALGAALMARLQRGLFG